MHKTFHTVLDVWEEQLADIARAETCIYFEQYLIEDVMEGKIGAKYIEALLKKAREGVSVRCIFDFVGSFALFTEVALVEKLREAGVDVFFYKSRSVFSMKFKPSYYFLRDHRKMLVIDDKVAWLGGVVVSESLRDSEDLMVRYDDPVIVAGLTNEFKMQYERLQETQTIIPPLQSLGKDSLLVGNAPGISNRFCYERLCHAVMLAEHSVTIVSPYFSLPFKLKRIIFRQLKRGITISLITPRQSDNRIADIGRESALYRCVKKGLKVYYLPFMNHAKAVITDDNWVSFGSTNFDALSLLYNHELNIETKYQPVVLDIVETAEKWRNGIVPITYKEMEYVSFPFYKKLFARVVRQFI
jgi:cardiolipin synthase